MAFNFGAGTNKTDGNAFGTAAPKPLGGTKHLYCSQ